MARGTEFIRRLEQHRALTLARRQPEPEPLSDRLLVSWIHHDNMLEGKLYRPAEIKQALDEQDAELDPYLHPLLREIRRYRDAIRFIAARANEGPSAVNLDNLKAIHRMLTPAPRDRGGLYRRTSPVHRDYFQRICSADKVPYHLRKLFEMVEAEGDDACDPVRFAAEVHHRLMYIYPFRRNPGTTARLFTTLLLLSRGYPPALLPAHRRDRYYESLKRPDAEQLADLFAEAVAQLLDAPSGRSLMGHVLS